MARLGIPVPPGVTLTTEVCTHFMRHNGIYPRVSRMPSAAGLGALEIHRGQAIRRPRQTAAVSVRSGARVSMPGMMDTVLNLGLNDVTGEGASPAARTSALSRSTAIRRFIQMYGDVVMGVHSSRFEQVLADGAQSARWR
jgi:pyruvate,orthophosphate dikinase